MSVIKITFPDGATKEFPKGITGLEVAQSISEGLARNVLSAKFNGKIRDAQSSLEENGIIQFFTWNDTEGKSTFWHSSAHLLAEALESLYAGIKFGIGPPIENGFYYDVDLNGVDFHQEHFPLLENKILELAKRKSEYKRTEVSKDSALQYFQEKNDPYKIELINNLEDGTISFYQQGNFIDLCRGPHIPHTGFIKAVKILNIAGAYWRGNEKNKQLTRIYAITFPKQQELTEYLHFLEEAKRRDHRKIGKEMELFVFSEKVGMGLPLWLPKGAILRECLETFMRKQQTKAGYNQVVSPHIGHKDLYITSGHYEKYGKDSFQSIKTPHEHEEFFLKPMNCPHHCEIYKSKPRSYKELPLRLAEFGTVYRYEQSGELHGLTRVRGFTQDDAHIFCMPDQVKTEFMKVIDLVLYVFNALGFEKYTAQISLRDQKNKEKYIGSDELWERAEREIIEAANEKKLETKQVEGEAAFYGPKLDFMVKDALNRNWQLGTIQVDYQLPKRFELEYIGSDNQKHTPVMIHRAPFGSLERFIAVLIEHCGGNFPLWLAPDQFAILPISEKFTGYAQKIFSILQENDIRGFIDNRVETINKKIREAEINKVPFMFIVGEKEQETETVSIREHSKGDRGILKLTELIPFFQNIVTESFSPKIK